ncbi:MAG: MgtC/SapB family protein [Chloroflexi bacterium]|nr:MgtC/SapB family protein [Chloroflexota bacterium]
MESNDYFITVIRLLGAMVAGALIGIERTYHGRPAGFRTHTLVATASSLLILLTVFFEQAIPGAPAGAIQLDPTRMAQGIMTGIGFLGAGVIIKEGLTIRGLTTAASIWITASIGIIIGAGLYFAAIIAEIITLGTLAVFNLIENRVPTFHFGRLTVRFSRDAIMSEAELMKVISDHGISFTNSSYYMKDNCFAYELTVRTQNVANFKKLTDTLRELKQVQEFSIVTPDN